MSVADRFLKVWCAGRVVGEVHISRYADLMSLAQVEAKRDDNCELVYYVSDPSRVAQIKAIIDAGEKPGWRPPVTSLNWLTDRSRLAMDDWRRQHRERDERTVLLVERMEHDA